MKSLRLALLLSIAAGTAAAQDPLAAARSTYESFYGTWAEPQKSCDRPVDTWNFGPGTVMAGTTALDVVGIGGGAGTILIDLTARATGERVPLSLRDTGAGIELSGSGIFASLVRCDAAFTPEDQTDAQTDTITTRSLDEGEAGPTTDELRDALGGGQAEVEPDVEVDPGSDPDPVALAETAFETRFAGSYSSPSGACDWQLSDSRITGAGQSYDVVNFSGEGERIGIQALRSDGSPTTFTVTPSGSGARIAGAVAGSDEPIDLTLAPC